ncbi:hypothetical membrane protein [Corynebacterium renale]|uniref:DUF3040 family protein n=1 Tax=Corynebacterium renale TaxID=1724 RepID=A0A2A9DQZ2_9CORY|nr:DUF3040 domain-containing protein [Corynebacterium renale]PFG28392.1 Protein of unknown function (DUF3040) [Corynebacterium renale]SQG65016.1 hypothetical membrane protein [Corynebacterium renale]SQI18788.1 hypothetical membrane protein [Corynebacterium renale]STC97138.1 hypothetical membrane protein [Corynebacterium renale]
MALSEQEQQALREIEASLLADDPKFGQSVKSEHASYGSGGAITLQGVALIAVGLVLLVAGVALAQASLWFIILSVLGFILMFGAGVWMLKGGGAQPSHGSRPVSRPLSDGRGSASSRKSAGSSMEEKFRKRFEQ